MRDREGSFHLLVHSPNGRSSQGWARPKPTTKDHTTYVLYYMTYPLRESIEIQSTWLSEIIRKKGWVVSGYIQFFWGNKYAQKLIMVLAA